MHQCPGSLLSRTGLLVFLSSTCTETHKVTEKALCGVLAVVALNAQGAETSRVQGKMTKPAFARTKLPT